MATAPAAATPSLHLERGRDPSLCTLPGRSLGFDGVQPRRRQSFEGCLAAPAAAQAKLVNGSQDDRPASNSPGVWAWVRRQPVGYTNESAANRAMRAGDRVSAPDGVKAERRYPLIPRQSKRWGDLYRGRSAVEREFGRLKNQYGLAPLRVRGLERVQLHADLVMLARLSQALSRARAVPLAA